MTVAQGNSTSDSPGQDSSPTEPAQIKNTNQNQTQTQNEGEEVQIQTQSQEEEKESEKVGQATGPTKAAQSGPQRNLTTRERMSDVAKKVDELLQEGQQFQGGIGDKVRKIAREQKKANEEIDQQLGKVEARQGLMRFILGPHHSALDQIEQQQEKNQQRIEQLSQLKEQVDNEAEATQIQETVQAIKQENLALAEQVRQARTGFSLFGWFGRMWTSLLG